MKLRAKLRLLSALSIMGSHTVIHGHAASSANRSRSLQRSPAQTVPTLPDFKSVEEVEAKIKQIHSTHPESGSREYYQKNYTLDLLYKIAVKLAQDEFERNRGAKSANDEAKDLLGKEIPYQPNKFGIDSRVKSVPSQELAGLYIKAIQEQYSVTNLNVVAGTGKYVEGFPLDDSTHLFDENAYAAREYKTFHQVFYSLIPNLNHEQEMAIRKMQTFDRIESLRSQMALTLIEGLKGGTLDADQRHQLDEIKAQIDKTIREFPGNDDSQRKAFIEALSQDPSKNADIAAVVEELKFQTRYAEAVANQQPMTLGKARLFFYMLGNYFVDAFDKDYVIWPKLMERPDAQGLTGSEVELRFYITPTKTFIKNVFSDGIPVDMVRAWNALQAKSAHSELELTWALQMVNRFQERNARYFTEKTHRRLLAAAEYLENSALMGRRVNVNWQGRGLPKGVTFEPSFKNKFEITLLGGEKITAANVLKLRAWNLEGKDATPMAITGIRYKFRDQTLLVTIDPARHHMSTQVKSDGLLGASIREERTFEENPYIPFDFKSPEFCNISGQLRLAIQNRLPLISAILLEVDRDFWAD